jgi:NTE family protein
MTMTTITKATNVPARPRLALVLGSGGVRSAAALGIADVLEGAGIRPDLIVAAAPAPCMARQLPWA